MLVCTLVYSVLGSRPITSITSISGGQLLSAGKSQNAGQIPLPPGSFADIAKTPYFCAKGKLLIVAPIYCFGSSSPTVAASSGGISCTVKFNVPDHVSGTSFLSIRRIISPFGLASAEPFEVQAGKFLTGGGHGKGCPAKG